MNQNCVVPEIAACLNFEQHKLQMDSDNVQELNIHHKVAKSIDFQEQ